MRVKLLLALMMGLLILSIPLVHAEALSYDTNGNLITGDGKFRIYNSLNQLSKIYNGSSDAGTLLEELTYHPTEERILTKKTYNLSGSVIETVIYVDENFVRVVNASGSYDFTYVKHEGQLVGQLNPDGAKLFIHGDHLGSTSAVTDSAGSLIESTTYTPYGEILTGGAVSRFDYTGKEYDNVVGDLDYNFRKYNPAWGLFTQPDSLLPNVYDPQQLNRYSYARNNPYRYKDENGHCIFGCIGDLLIITAVSMAFIASLYFSTEVVARDIKSKTGQPITPEDDQALALGFGYLAEKSVELGLTITGQSPPGVTGTINIIDDDSVAKRAEENLKIIDAYCQQKGKCPQPALVQKKLVNKEIVNAQLIKTEVLPETKTGKGSSNAGNTKSKTQDRPWWKRHTYIKPVPRRA